VHCAHNPGVAHPHFFFSPNRTGPAGFSHSGPTPLSLMAQSRPTMTSPSSSSRYRQPPPLSSGRALSVMFSVRLRHREGRHTAPSPSPPLSDNTPSVPLPKIGAIAQGINPHCRRSFTTYPDRSPCPPACKKAPRASADLASYNFATGAAPPRSR
jgi:hypothetical protein